MHFVRDNAVVFQDDYPAPEFYPIALETDDCGVFLPVKLEVGISAAHLRK